MIQKPWWKALLASLRERFVPMLAEAAFYFALVYSLAVLAQSACRAYAAEPIPPVELPDGLRTEGVELTCEIAVNVEGALALEFAVLFERIKEASTADENDPRLFIFGHQFKGMLAFEKALQAWLLEHHCKAMASAAVATS